MHDAAEMGVDLVGCDLIPWNFFCDRRLFGETDVLKGHTRQSRWSIRNRRTALRKVAIGVPGVGGCWLPLKMRGDPGWLIHRRRMRLPSESVREALNLCDNRHTLNAKFPMIDGFIMVMFDRADGKAAARIDGQGWAPS